MLRHAVRGLMIIILMYEADEPTLSGGKNRAPYWLWAWPEILGWPSRITWLFSPPSGRRPWQADLWGVDANGELIIVETKSTLTPRDPFRCLLSMQERLSNGDWSPTVANFCDYWEPRLRDERQFLKTHREALQDGSGQLSKQ